MALAPDISLVAVGTLAAYSFSRGNLYAAGITTRYGQCLFKRLL